MIILDKPARDALKKIYTQLESKPNITVSSPEYEGAMIDYFVEHKLLNKKDVSTIGEWCYIVFPTYEGKMWVKNCKSVKVEAFINRGEAIMVEEYHHEAGSGMVDYISGPKSDQWFSEIDIFNSRYLGKHPLHDRIATVCKNHNRSMSAHEDMMGYLRALLSDDKLDEDDSLSDNILNTNNIMMHNNQGNNYIKKKYQVFISSTYRDLIEERAAVTQCLWDCDCIPVGMEQFPASGMSQMEYIKKMLDECDYYILILAGRYGSLDTDGIGFTEKEYDYAKRIGLPVMSFVINDIGTLASNKCEADDRGRALLRSFREKVCKDSLVKMYSNIGDLKAGVTVSIKKCIEDHPAVGWIRASDVG